MTKNIFRRIRQRFVYFEEIMLFFDEVIRRISEEKMKSGTNKNKKFLVTYTNIKNMNVFENVSMVSMSIVAYFKRYGHTAHVSINVPS